MIFQYTWPSILAEKKTQTRRLISANESAIRGRNNRILAVTCNGRTKWQVGESYAVQTARGKSQIARIQITRIRSEMVLRISNADARAEGFANRKAFLETWQQIHGNDKFFERVWVVEFALVSVVVEKDVFAPKPLTKQQLDRVVYAS